MPLNEAKRVIVRVWTSKENRRFPGNSVGHVSIQTPEEYISLWPVSFSDEERVQYRRAGKLGRTQLCYFGERKADFHVSCEDDIKAEEDHTPQVTICFYSLDAYMLENTFHKLKTTTTHWRLIGSNLFLQELQGLIGTEKNGYVESCASLALKILKAGGISNLVGLPESTSFCSKTSSVVKPDTVLEFLIPAKLTELRKHPETINFNHKDETIIDNLKQPSSGWECTIM